MMRMLIVVLTVFGTTVQSPIMANFRELRYIATCCYNQCHVDKSYDASAN